METQQSETTKKIPYAMALFHSLGVVVYVALVALFMQNAETFLGPQDDIVSIIAFLLLFTVSAAVVGSLIFARPALMAINGKKKEAITFTTATIGFLLVELVISFVIIALI